MTPTPFIAITPDAGRVGPVWWVNATTTPVTLGPYITITPHPGICELDDGTSILPFYAAHIIHRHYRNIALNELAALTEYDE